MRIVLIIDLNDTGSEAEALRQALEGFDYFVCVKHIGRPNDFIDILDGNVPIDPDFVIISCHGDNGKIHMSRLADFVYSDNEPRDDFSSAEVERYLKLSQKTIINLGCTTGEEKLAKAFSKNNVYIAPCDYIEGAAAFFHISRVWGRLLPNKIPRKTKLSIMQAGFVAARPPSTNKALKLSFACPRRKRLPRSSRGEVIASLRKMSEPCRFRQGERYGACDDVQGLGKATPQQDSAQDKIEHTCEI